MIGVQATNNRRSIMVLTIGLFCFVLPTAYAAALSLTSPLGPVHKCDTTDCRVERLETAAYILKYRDEKSAPCDNFYQHVCGKYDKSDFSHNFNFIEAARSVAIGDMIEEEMEWVDESPVYKLIRDFYKVCINDDARGDKAWETLKNKIKNLGGWPAVEGDKWKEADFNLADFIGKAKKEGYDENLIFDWEPINKMENGEPGLGHSLQMAPTQFDSGMDPLEPTHIGMYIDFMKKTATKLGADNANLDSDINAAIEFEKKLYNITHDTSGDSKSMTMEDLQKEFPDVDWSSVVDKTLTPFLDPGDTPELEVNKMATVGFFRMLKSTTPRVQATYGIWKVIQATLPFFSGEHSKPLNEFHQHLNEPEMPREAFCDEMTTEFADLAVTKYYLEHFDSSIETIGKMFSVIKEKMIEMIKESKTLSEDEKKEGVEIMQGMEHTIGSSDELSDLHELEKFYADAKVTEDNFVQTVLDMNAFITKKKNSKKLRKEAFKFSPERHGQPGMPENFQNHLYIPTSMVQNLMFDNNQPMYMNFGAAGSLMASQMFKSVAHLGKKKGEVGKLDPTDQQKCFLQLAQNVSDLFLSDNFDISILDDMMAQYIGFKAAYRAYQQYVAESGPELPLPEVPNTVQQLFWISWAQVFCFANTEDMPLPNSSEGSSPGILDTMMMLVVKNLPEISADFNCPVGSNLNPEKKCTVW